ncbi:MAG: peptidoglycan-binding domain-containing protein [Deltaproteobacteria bacterium]|jgi:peptidoglycan hydrolase-like protein with peptidoglycan-binding domain
MSHGSISRDPNRVSRARELAGKIQEHRDAADAGSADAQTVQADIQEFRDFHHQEALADVAADSTGAHTADNDYLAAVEELNAAYESALDDGELSEDEQTELLEQADVVRQHEVLSRDTFMTEPGSDPADVDHDMDPTESAMPPAGVNPPRDPASVPDPGRITYDAAPTADQIEQGAPLGFGHDDDGDNTIVSDVQQELYDGGYYGEGATADEVDGYFGPRTHAATVAFQEDNGLEPDGTIDQDDLVALGLAEPAQALPDSPVLDFREASGPSEAEAADFADRGYVDQDNGFHLHGDAVIEDGDADALEAAGYVTDGSGTYFHPDLLQIEPSEEDAEVLLERGFLTDGNGTYYHPAIADHVPDAAEPQADPDLVYV